MSSKRKKEEFYVLLCSSPCICRLLQACIFRETSTKATNNANILSRWLSQILCRLSDFTWLSSLPYLHIFTDSFCWLSHSLDSYLKQTGLSCLPLSTALSVFSRTFLPSFTSGLAGYLALSPLCGFRAKKDKEIVWVAPTNCYASCHTSLRISK